MIIRVKTRTTRTPAFWGYPRRLMITHTIESYWIPRQKKTKSKLQISRISQNFKFLNFETNITHNTPSEIAWYDVQIWKGVRGVLLKIQSGHASVHWGTDGQGDTSIPLFQLRWSGGIIIDGEIYYICLLSIVLLPPLSTTIATALHSHIVSGRRGQITAQIKRGE